MNEALEKILVSRVMDDELTTAKANKADETSDFESYMAMMDSVRDEKEYDWMSDIRIPEFASQVHTQSSIDVDQNFKTRDFVEVYVQDESDEALAAAKAAQELLNRTLNRRELFHYLKYVRAKGLTNVAGRCYAVCQWEQELQRVVVGQEERFEVLDVDDFGNKIVDEELQLPAIRSEMVDIEKDIPKVDQFDYEIVDQRNVFTDNKYVYSLQHKDFVIIRTEKTLEELKRDEKKMGYENLDALSEMKSKYETETSQETYNREKKDAKTAEPQSQDFDIYTRYGKYWAVVTERDAEGSPLKAEPGWNLDDELREGAEFIEMIITFAQNGNMKRMIRFQPTPYIDAHGRPFRPLLRGLCYVHFTEDNGVGDGLYARDLQTAIDDTFNMSNDRTQFATFPTLKGKKYALEDNSTVYFEPMHVIELEDTNDLEEFKISDNTQGALNQMAVITGKMQQLTAITPPSMGGQVAASTTATAIAGAEQHTNIRTNYKSLTFDNTFTSDLYWMIQQMTFRFAHEDTAMKLMGDKVFDFDPSLDYFYKPLSQSVETEQSKFAKIDRWNTSLGYVAQSQNPKTPVMVNYIMAQVFKLMGDEHANFANKFLDEEAPMDTGGMNVEPGAGGTALSNQAGMTQSPLEQFARGASA